MLTNPTWLNPNPLYATGMELGAQAGEQANRLNYARQHDADELLLNYSQLGANIWQHQKELEAQKAREAVSDAYRQAGLDLDREKYDFEVRKAEEKAAEEEKRRKEEQDFFNQISGNVTTPVTPTAPLSMAAPAAPTQNNWQPGLPASEAPPEVSLVPPAPSQPATGIPPTSERTLQLLQQYPRVAESPRFKAWMDLTKPEGPQSNIAKMQADLARARGRGDADAVRQLTAAIELAATEPSEEFIGYNNDGSPIFKYKKGGKGGDSTVAMQSRAQESITEMGNAMGLINYLQQNLKPEHLGIQGNIGEMAMDRTLAQFIPQMANTQRIKARDTVRWLRETMLRKVGDDKTGRYSAADRKEIEQLLPETGVFESGERANAALSRTREILSDRARNYAKRSGEAPPLWSLSASEIKALYQKGLDTGGKEGISLEEAKKALEVYH